MKLKQQFLFLYTCLIIYIGYLVESFQARLGMGSQVLTSSDRSRTYWTPPMERYFVDLMLDQVLKGNRIGHTFNKQAWTDMLTMFNANFGSKYDKDVLKGRYKNMWEQYNDVKNLLEKGGFAWDETRQMVIAADHDWDAYVKAHPEARCYKTKPILNYDDFCLIYGYTTADGRYSLSSHDADLYDEIPRMKSGVGNGTQKPNDSDRSRTNWTPDMDRCFVDLMLDQVHKGNKIEHTFNKKAWTEMILLFNEKFESKYSKNVLRSRYKILRKHYSDIKVLLGQNGFDLDESRKMVIADDCTWDAYIKAHPDARSCRTTSVPDYNDLYMIYGNEIADGRIVRSVHKAGRGDDVSRVNIGERKEGLLCLTYQTPTSFDRSRTYWTPPMDRYFIDLMLDQVCKGNKIENTFIAQAWIDMTALFNTRFLSHHNKEVLKNRYKSLRKQYTDINILLEQNGFTWDETRQMVRADDNIWDTYVKEHPDARSYRTRIVPNYKDLCLICGSTSANRRCNRLDQNTNYDIRDISIGEMGNQDITSYDSSGTYWTPQMDRYFIDLMLEHLNMGNKIDAKETWTVIITLFNAEFGSQYGEDVLRHHYQDLWIQYNDIKSLLGQSGLSWDESQQMIIADDDVGNTFIQDHPDVQSYINKTVPYYNDLCMIFENASAGERSSCEDDADLHYDVAKSTDGERMGCQVSTQCDGSLRTYWTPPMDRYFIDLMLEQVQKGNQVDNTFNREAWMEMIILFNVTFGSQHDGDFLKSHYNNLRRQFIYIKSLLGQNGFLWDETRQMVIADDDTWDSYLKEHPDALSYRTKKALDYNSLCVIYGNATANGEENHTREDADPKIDDDIVTNKTEEKDSDAPTISDRSRTYWTPPMDRYFIDLMLDQVQKGNKVDHTFNKQAWGHMITCFNGKFRSHYDKDVLKSRYKNLRKQYNYIKILLDQNDFDWDENRQMVTADEDVWDSYIKKHPDAQSYRNKFLANYKDLCFIYGNGSADGRESHSRFELELDSQVMIMTTDTISGGLQSCVTSVSHRDPVDDVKEAITHSDRQPQKRPSTTTLIHQKSGKLLKTEDSGMQDYFVGEMPVLVNQKKDNENSDPIGNMMSSLQALPDMDEDLILDACDLLEDERKAKTFLALDVKLRKKWLLRKLRP